MSRLTEILRAATELRNLLEPHLDVEPLHPGGLLPDNHGVMTLLAVSILPRTLEMSAELWLAPVNGSTRTYLRLRDETGFFDVDMEGDAIGRDPVIVVQDEELYPGGTLQEPPYFISAELWNAAFTVAERAGVLW